ncbi:MAG: phosphoglucomutase (alpha-D-glucose-1,6-bisphosphate-dependent) [Thermodesulfobacteriota bacterium]
MSVHELAGLPAPKSLLADIPKIVSAYYTGKPDATVSAQRVAFGTSGHRGTSLDNSFNEDHIVAISQAICEYRAARNISGPLFMGRDTHALSEPAMATALEIFAAARVPVMIQEKRGFTPTPVISHAVLTYNRNRSRDFADGVVITPSHNPPADGGFKYNPPHGGPADESVTRIIADRANEILGNPGLRAERLLLEKALKTASIHTHDFITPYVRDLAEIIDMEAIRSSGLHLGVDPMGGAGVHFWEPIADLHGLSMEVVNPHVDPTFAFMPLDKDGKIRMDCSSPFAMQGLIALKDRFDLAFGNDPDVDRHGIVTAGAGLLNPNHYLAVAIWYLFQNRPAWPKDAMIGKTLVSTSMIDRVAASLSRKLCEVPVGFKWFVDGLLTGTFGFGGEESAGATFLRKNGRVWTTDKDGIVMNLLAAEIMAKTGKDLADLYHMLEERHGVAEYERMDAPADQAQKELLKKLSPEMVMVDSLAGEPIIGRLTRAPGNQAPIGGLKVVTENGWFAARPSGTEDIYKIYAESFKGKHHLRAIQEEAKSIVGAVFAAATTPEPNQNA